MKIELNMEKMREVLMNLPREYFTPQSKFDKWYESRNNYSLKDNFTYGGNRLRLEQLSMPTVYDDYKKMDEYNYSLIYSLCTPSRNTITATQFTEEFESIPVELPGYRIELPVIIEDEIHSD